MFAVHQALVFTQFNSALEWLYHIMHMVQPYHAMHIV
jgi:hypothetical protein